MLTVKSTPCASRFASVNVKPTCTPLRSDVKAGTSKLCTATGASWTVAALVATAWTHVFAISVIVTVTP